MLRSNSFRLVTTIFGFVLATANVGAVKDLKTDWSAYANPVVIPDVVDATAGGSFDIVIGETQHDWVGDGSLKGTTYSYGLKSGKPTYPGPTIKVKKGVPISVVWYNELQEPHILDSSVERTVIMEESRCYPYCGIPAVVHVHGLESPAKYDGLPMTSVYKNQTREMVYVNTQSASTKLYHDHAMGLTRLNVWAGLIGMYIIQDAALDKSLNVDFEADFPLLISDKLISKAGKLLYSDDSCLTSGSPNPLDR